MIATCEPCRSSWPTSGSVSEPRLTPCKWDQRKQQQSEDGSLVKEVPHRRVHSFLAVGIAISELLLLTRFHLSAMHSFQSDDESVTIILQQSPDRHKNDWKCPGWEEDWDGRKIEIRSVTSLTPLERISIVHPECGTADMSLISPPDVSIMHTGNYWSLPGYAHLNSRAAEPRCTSIFIQWSRANAFAGPNQI